MLLVLKARQRLTINDLLLGALSTGKAAVYLGDLLRVFSDKHVLGNRPIIKLAD